MPQVAREAHSAKSISDHVCKDQHLSNHARFKALPYYRMIPADGAIESHDLIVFFQENESIGEQIFIQVNDLPEVATKTKYSPVQRRITLPPNIFHRFISLLHECSDVKLRLRMLDPDSDDYILLSKMYKVGHFQITIEMRVMFNAKGNDRYTIIRTTNLSQRELYPDLQIAFPHYKTYELVETCKSVHKELVASHLI